MRTLLLSAAVLLTLVTAGRAAPALGDKPPKWEYAELTFRTIPSRPAGVDADGKQIAAVPGYVSLRWVTGAGEVEAKGWEELSQKLKGPALKNGSAAFQKIQVLNHLGGEGWELMEHHVTSPAAPTALGPRGDRGPSSGAFGPAFSPTTCLLKRRVP